MNAVRFAAPIPTYLLTLLAGRLSPALWVGPHACTRFGEIEEPRLPGDRWVRLGMRLGGICGSDLGVVTLGASPSTSPFSSFPFVLGHEIVADVLEVGAGVRSVARGDRVAVNPLLGCVPRDVSPPCEECVSGRPSRCRHFVDGVLAPGIMIGTTRSLGGGWGERLVAHESQLHALPAALNDEDAVLIEPLACSVHAVRAATLARGARVLVIGAGSIGLLTTAALRAHDASLAITVAARHPFQAEHAERLGASHVVRGADPRALAEIAGARLLQPILGEPIAVGGFDATFVCVGGTRAMADALRFTRSGGTVMLLGNVGRLDGVDWTPLWLKELSLRGTLCYGVDAAAPGRPHAFDEAVDLIASGRVAAAPLVTHVFPIGRVREAIGVALDKRHARCVKVAFRPSGVIERA